MNDRITQRALPAALYSSGNHNGYGSTKGNGHPSIEPPPAGPDFSELFPLMSSWGRCPKLAAGAPKAHRASPHNLLAEFDMAYGDVDAAFSKTAHVFRESLWQHRGGGHSIECRCVFTSLQIDFRLQKRHFIVNPLAPIALQ